MRQDHIVNCWDLERAGLWDMKNCCVSCHDDQDDGYVDFMCGWPLPRKDGEGNLDDDWYFDVCCRCGDTAKALTRDQWALALRLKRKAIREALEPIDDDEASPAIADEHKTIAGN